jgi:hypothetical protein
VQNPQVKRQHGEDKEVEDDPEEELVQAAELEMNRSKRAKKRASGVGPWTSDNAPCQPEV